MRNKKLIILCGLIMSCAISAYPVDLTNNDHVKHDVKVHTKWGTETRSINAMTTQAGVCQAGDECDIEVIGVGTIHAKGLQEVTIQNGKLTVR